MNKTEKCLAYKYQIGISIKMRPLIKTATAYTD